MNELQSLAELSYQEQKKKHQRVPTYAIVKPKYSDKTANELTRAIIDYICLKVDQAERVTSMRRVLNQGLKQQYIPTTGQKGTADISATKLIEIDGRKIGVRVAIEVKIGRDKQSGAQRDYQYQIQQAGGVYIIATSFEQFIESWNKI